MRNILILIFGLLSFSGSSQISAMLMTEPEAAGATYLLDDYPADAAYSLRLLKADQIDSAAIRVRRSSDNAEQDIGFTAEGYLDTASMKTFVGANSGYVVTWYDQSGSENDATQSTAANQARIINAGTVDRLNGRVAMLFDGVNDYYTSASSYTPTQEMTLSTVFKGIGSAADQIIGDQNDRKTSVSLRIQFSQFVVYNGETTTKTSNGVPSNSNQNLIIWGRTTSECFNVLNAGTPSTVAISAYDTTSQPVYIGARAGGTLPLDGYIQEHVLWLSNKYPNYNGIESNTNSHYSIY